MTTLNSAAIESLTSTEGPDVLTGTSGDDVIDGLGGDDIIDGLEGNDTLSGGADYDTVAGGAGADIVDGGTGNDVLYSAGISPPFGFPYYGNPYTPPQLDTASEVDTVAGGGGDDMLFVGYGDNADGGEGFDQLFISFQGAASGVAFDASLGTQVIGGGTITGIESVNWVEGSNYDDTVNLNGANGYWSNVAFGMAGNDTLIGGFYTSLLDGGEGNDVLDGTGSLYYLQRADGGAGDDIIYTNTSLNMVADGGDGNDTIYSAGETHGGNGNDTIVLSFGFYGIQATGDAGDDVIQGSGSDEVLSGGAGLDLLTGGGGNDRFIFRLGDGQDVITDFAAGDIVQVEGYESYEAISQVGNDAVLVLASGDQITFQNTDIATVEDALLLVDAPPPQGTEGDDTLAGQSGNDVIEGLGGDDTLVGRSGDDVLAGGAGADTIDGGTGNDALFSADVSPPFGGNPYTPLLDTGSEVDTLTGGAGGDRLYAGYGDNVDGGENGWTGDYLYISFQGASEGIAVDFRLESQVIGGGTITGIENVSWVEGSNFDDYINVQSYAGPGYSDYTAVFGMGGNDQLIAGYYTGTLDGGDGNDVVDGRSSQHLQLVEGGAGDDTLYTNTHPFTVASGGDGNDTIYSHGETHGGAGNDTIILTAANFILIAVSGDAGDDTITGTTGNDFLDGGAGSDLITGGRGADTLSGGADQDRFLFQLGDGNDQITDFAAGDVLAVNGYDSAQSITQVGSDVVVVFSNEDQVIFSNTDVATVEGGIEFAPPTDDVIVGGSGNDYLLGFGGDDTISGGGGYDTLAGNSGADTLDGGDDGDTLYSANISPPFGFPYYGIPYTPPLLDTGSEVDTLTGGAGDDTLFVGYGDNADGGEGLDQLFISFQGAASGIAFDASLGTQVIGGGTITGIESVNWVEGSNYDDTVNLNGANGYSTNVAFGMAGNDTLIAGYYTSLLDGGEGNDVVDGRGSQYLQLVEGGAGDDTLYTNTFAVASGGDGNDTIYSYGQTHGGDGNDTIYSHGDTHGGNGNDTIVLSFSYYGIHAAGDAGDDVIQGSEGSEVLSGGTGADVLGGGGGNDRFLYNVGDGDDRITDIAAGDVVEIHGYAAVQAMTQLGGDVVVVFAEGDQITFSNTDIATVEDALLLVDAPPPQGTEGDDTLAGQSGNDIIDGLGGDDTLVGRGGDDVLAGGAGADTVDGGTGNDVLYSTDILPPFSFPYYGIPYTPPLLDTGSEVDTLTGDAGDDTLFVGYGDNADGGEGLDQLFISFQGAASGVAFDASLGTQVIGGGTITGIESVSWVDGSNYDDTVNLNGAYGYSFNVAFGMAGNDTLIAGYYTSLLDGGEGNDVVDGRGSQYLQLVEGGAGDDTLYTDTNTFAVASGGDGNDTIYSHGETHGGAGNDTIVLTQTYYPGAVSGDAGDDTITGSAGGDFLDGGAGLDLLIGGGGNDRFMFRLGDGQDVITDFAAGDIVQVEGYDSYESIAQVGNDAVLVFASGDQITFQNADVATVEAGIEFPSVTIIGGPDDEYLNGYGGNDTIAGGGGADIIDGGRGNDNLFSGDPDFYWSQPDAGTEHDVLIGGKGDDRLTIGYGDDADGGEGTDTLRLSFGGASDGVTFYTGALVSGQPVTVAGGTIQNMEVLEYLGGSNFADQLTIAAQEGAISVDGLDGDDFIAVEGGAGITIRGGAGFDRVDIYGGNVTVFGDEGNDSVFVNGGTAYAIGGWGDDYFVSGSGADIFFGDDGNDRVSYLFSGSGVTVDLSTGATPDGDQLYGIESVDGSSHADRLTGDWQSNGLYGGNGNDTLEGLDGDDLLDGGAGIDTLTGGFGNDIYRIDNAKDVVVETESGGTDRVLTSINYTLDENIENAQAIGSGAVKLVGNSLDNSLEGNEASNILIGAAGNDILDGREGADTMNGGAGNDTYIVDHHGDKIGEGANEGTDEVVTLVSYTLASKVQVETMTAVGGMIDLTGNEFAQTLQGNDFDNVLAGNGSNDTLIGWDGSDTLKGGTGNDVLIGGWGDDRFVFEKKPGNDVIQDFESGSDKIDLHAFGITMNQVNAVAGAEATILYVDSNRDGSSDFTITLMGVGVPDAGDYIL